MKRDAYIFGAGEPSVPLAPPPRDDVLVIAADGGYDVACRAFGSPDIAVGDFDSLGYVPSGIACLCHPAEKDDTDLALAADLAVARGAVRLHIYAALGGRLDHTVANLQLLCALASRGVRATLHGADGVAVTALSGGECAAFSPRGGGILSLFAFGGEAVGVTASGLKYPLTEARLTPERPLGISNEFVGMAASVSLRTGKLILFYNEKEGDAPVISTKK